MLVLRVSHRRAAYDDEKQITAKAGLEIDEFRERKKEEKVKEAEDEIP